MSNTLSGLAPQRHSYAGTYICPRELAEWHGSLESLQRCRRCGAWGKSYDWNDGSWGFVPRTRCGDPLKCGDKPNMNGGAFPLIEGGKHE